MRRLRVMQSIILYNRYMLGVTMVKKPDSAGSNLAVSHIFHMCLDSPTYAYFLKSTNNFFRWELEFLVKLAFFLESYIYSDLKEANRNF